MRINGAEVFYEDSRPGDSNLHAVLHIAANAHLDIVIKPVSKKWVEAIQKDLEPDR